MNAAHRLKAALALFLLFPAARLAASEKPWDTAKIETLTGLKGELNEIEGVFNVGYVRPDLFVSAAGVKITPPMGLTDWAAFQRSGEKTLVQGELALGEDQANAVLSAALDNGLEVSSLQDHFFWDWPKVVFLRFGGQGEEEKLAAAVGAVFAKLKETGNAQGLVRHVDIDTVHSRLNAAKIGSILGAAPQSSGGVLSFAFPKYAKIEGEKLAGALGAESSLIFAGTDDRAVAEGDLAVYEIELQGVLKALRAANLSVTGIQSRYSLENPRLIFVRCWGIGAPEELAQGLKAALDAQAK